MATLSTRDGSPLEGSSARRDSRAAGLSRPLGLVVEDGLPGRERVERIQRARIIAAMSELVRELGPGAVTVADIVGRSGVSRRTFYELFSDREACLLAAFEHAVQRAAAVVVPAYEHARKADKDWEEQIRAGLGALLRFMDEEPALAGLCIVDALAAEQRVLAYRAGAVERLVEVVYRGSRARSPGGSPAARRPTRIVAEGIVGAVLAVIHARLREPSSKPLAGLLNPLMGIVVLPYLGSEAAERELTRPTERGRKRVAYPADPLRELDMRLTYRTVRVLLAISEHPTASGRQVADAAGISDQGQTSKLLRRLEHLGLIGNSAAGRGKGEPNAWTLTAKGEAVEQAIQLQTDTFRAHTGS